MTGTSLKVIESSLRPMLPTFQELLRGLEITPERIMRTVIIACDRTPRLRECTLDSILQAATTGAVLGLEADGVSGQGFLLPFKDTRANVLRAQWVTGYKGYTTIAGRAHIAITGDVVREGDEFWFRKGSDPHVHHAPVLGNEKDRRIIAAYAVARSLHAPPIQEVMSIDEILEIKRRSPAGSSKESPWNQPGVPFAAMCTKTPRRRLARSLPLLPFVVAARVDEAYEEQRRHAWIGQDRVPVIGGQRETPPTIEQEAPKLGQPQPQPEQPQKLGLLPDANRFLLTTGRQKQYCSNIEEWRSRAIIWMNKVKADDPFEAKKKRRRPLSIIDKLESFEEAMTPTFADLADDYAQDVKAVADHLNRKLGRK